MESENPQTDQQHATSLEIFTPLESSTSEQTENEVKKIDSDQKRKWFYIILAGGGILLTLISVLILSYTFQSNFIYRPMNFTTLPKTFEFQCSYDRMEIKSQDGTKLSAFHSFKGLKGDLVPFVIIYFQGHEGNIFERGPIVNKLIEKIDCSVYTFSYRGFGISEGKPSEIGIKEDSQALLDFVVEKLKESNWKDRKIVLFGEGGLGGAVAIDLAARNPKSVHYVILENTFLSLPKLLSVKRPILYPFLSFVNQIWDNESAIKQVKQKILFIIGEKDDVFPPDHSLRLYDLATESAGKSIVRFKKGGHLTTWSELGFFSAINRFLLF